MKKTLLQLAVISGMLITMSTTVNAQWTHNAATNQTYLTNAGANVGIGLTNPAFKLDIYSNTGAASINCKSTTGNSNLIIDRANTASTAGVNYRTNGVVYWQTGTIGTDNFAIRNNQLGSPAVSIQNTTNNVGIGTTAPGSLLSVGSISGAVATPTAITMDNSYLSGAQFNKLKFYLFKDAVQTYGFGLGSSGDVQYWAGSSAIGMHRFFTAQQERMRIDENGNVGIGTINPNAQFNVVQNQVGPVAIFDGVSPNYESTIVLRLDGNAGYLSHGGWGLGANVLGFGGQNHSYPDIRINTITSQVAIGNATTAAGYMLTVAGKVICTELKVQLQPFPDYVFSKDYDLKSIEEVEQHINTYNRLPGMPSACEVEEGGMSVGEMTGKVVEKVEENTLYIIQLKKEIDALKAELNALKK